MRRTETHLQLAIDLDSDPISGSVSNGVQGARAFTGWIELVAVIEAARSSSHAGEDGRPGVEPE
jgi:hypothetical protein